MFTHHLCRGKLKPKKKIRISRKTQIFIKFRFHGSSVVDFDSARGGISLETEKTESGTSSRLMLTRAALRDSGNYTCVPAGAVSASVLVYVLNGKSKFYFI